MFFPKQCKLHLVAAKDEGRYRMNCILYRDGKLFATDGRRAAVINVEDSTGEAEGALIPAHLVKLATGKAPEDLARVWTDGTAARALTKEGTVTSELAKGDFPSIETILPEVPEARKATVGLNAKYLFELAQAIGCEDTQVVLELDLELLDPYSSYPEPIRVQSPHGVGIIMPVTVERPEAPVEDEVTQEPERATGPRPLVTT